MTISRVVIPLDVANVSLAAVDCGHDLARRLGVASEVMSVTSPKYANVTKAALRQLVDDSDHSSIRVIATDRHDVEGVLVDEVVADDTALWCLGSHGRTAVGELLFGSTSADLVRDAEVAIVVVGPHASVRPDAQVLAIALDGTELSETIVPSAVALAAQLKLTLRLLQVGHAELPADSLESAFLSRVAATINQTTPVDYDTLHGDTSKELAGYLSRTADVAILAMATRGIPGGARVSVPSIAMRVLRHAATPVLLLHPPQEPASGVAGPAKQATAGSQGDTEPQSSVEPGVDDRPRIVVGLDTLAASEPALRWAADEASRRGVLLQVVHTWQIPVGSIYGAAVWPEVEACRDAALETVTIARDAIASWQPELDIETVVAEGGAAHTLVARSRGAILVVLGTRHHSWLSRAVFGSTPASAIAHTHCPLVIVPCDAPAPVA
jgi:nucleotide-binding universal stress UspA family protein